MSCSALTLLALCSMSGPLASPAISSLPHPKPHSCPPLPAEVQVLNALEHRYDNPSSIPSRELSKLIYGADSVFARESTPASVRAMHAVHVLCACHG
jgi:hypothetical protein